MAQVFGNNLTSAATKESTYADGKYTITDLTAGYYLVKDQKESIGTDDNDAYTRFMLKVVSDVTASPKSSIPTVKKFVKDINDSTETEKSDWQKSADHDVNNDVDFRLEGTLPSTYDDYSVYKYVFNDSLEDGFTYNQDSVKVYVENGGVKTEIDVTPTFDTDTNTMKVEIADLKVVRDMDGSSVTIDKDSKITVEYTAKLDDDAVLGSTGNKGDVELVYSNNPNKD
ncbi:MAG: isopeptide-forming domain-containing fimbrial protein, partial [Acutalibacteraceae bacterium]